MKFSAERETILAPLQAVIGVAERRKLRVQRLVSACILALLSAAAPAQEMVNGKVVVPERRIQSFANSGVSRENFTLITSRMDATEGDGPHSWVREWSNAAAQNEKVADGYAASGDKPQALKAYMLTSAYYAIAGFPEYYTPAEKQALHMHLAAYEKAGRFMDAPLQVIPVEVRGHRIKTYFHRPAAAGKPPLLLWTNGTDSFKGHAYGPVSKLVSMGFAVVTFDLPGVGESDFWKLTPDGEFVHRAVLDQYAARSDIDAANIFEVGVSFGGYFAAKMAARNDPRLRAVAAICGPVHAAFARTPGQFGKALASQEGRTVRAFAHRIGADADDPASISAAAAKFSLVNQKIITPGVKSITTPLLIANGGRDPLVPATDMHLLASAAQNTEVWTLGMAEHCAAEYFQALVPDIGEWLLDHSSKAH